MLLGHDVTRAGQEFVAELAAPRSELERSALPCRFLNGRDVFPGFVVAGTISAVPRGEQAGLPFAAPVEDLVHFGEAPLGLCQPLPTGPYHSAPRTENTLT